MGTTAGQFIAALTESSNVIVIGGLAVIAHGFNRPTKDADVWLEPLDSPSAWADALEQVCSRFPGLTIPDSEVTELAMGYLREFADDGDPFSQALLANAPVPPN